MAFKNFAWGGADFLSKRDYRKLVFYSHCEVIQGRNQQTLHSTNTMIRNGMNDTK